MTVVSNRITSWFLINIKARTDQQPSHYVQTLKNLEKEDPMVELRREKCISLKSIEFSPETDNNSICKWIKLKLISYTIIDTDSFYNKREKEDVHIDDWDNDIVANRKEAEVYFIPSVHTVAVKQNSQINIKHIVEYFSESLNRLEPETFDVNIITERDVLDQILNAYSIQKIEASILYSNPSSTNGFRGAFDSKLRAMNPSQFEIVAKGTKDNPLVNEEDGMINAIVDAAERDGNIIATIMPTEGAKLVRIDSREHPRKLRIPQIVHSIGASLYNAMINIF